MREDKLCRSSVISQIKASHFASLCRRYLETMAAQQLLKDTFRVLSKKFSNKIPLFIFA